MPDARSFNVLVTAEYETGAACAWDAAQRVIEALRTGGLPWPVALKVEVGENA